MESVDVLCQVLFRRLGARRINVVTLPREIPLGPHLTQFLSVFSPPSFPSSPVPLLTVCVRRIVYSVMSVLWCLLVPQVALLDIDICGPSIPKIMGLEGEQVRAVLQNTESGLSQKTCYEPLGLNKGVSSAHAFLWGHDETR